MNKWKLKKYIENAGYTQRTFSALIGMSENALSNKMNEKTDFRSKEISDICNALNITDAREKVEIFLP